MKTIYSEKLPRILKSKKRLEAKLNVKITNQGQNVSIDGEAEDEYIAEKVIDALNFGFPFSDALLIKEEDNMFEVINIKDHTKRRVNRQTQIAVRQHSKSSTPSGENRQPP